MAGKKDKKQQQQKGKAAAESPKITTPTSSSKQGGDSLRSPQGKGQGEPKEGPSVEELFGRLKSAVNKEEYARVVKTANESKS